MRLDIYILFDEEGTFQGFAPWQALGIWTVKDLRERFGEKEGKRGLEKVR